MWVDGVRDGSLALLLGRSDVFSGNVQPLKLGRLRIELEPNPFAGWFHDDDDGGGGGGGGGGGSAASTTTPSFSQTLDLQRGLLNISAGGVNITVWSDINAVGTADSVHVEVSSPGAPVSVNVQVDSWRLDPMFVDCHNNARGPCEKNFTLPADTLVHGSYYSDPFYALGWFRRNEQSVFKQTLRDQQMGARNIGNASNSIFLCVRWPNAEVLAPNCILISVLSSRGLRCRVYARPAINRCRYSCAKVTLIDVANHSATRASSADDDGEYYPI